MREKLYLWQLCIIVSFAALTGWQNDAYAREKIVLSVPQNWEVLNGIDGQENYVGLLNYTKNIFRELGYDVIYKINPYKRALEETRRGQVAGTFASEEIGYIGKNYVVSGPVLYTDTSVLYPIELGEDRFRDFNDFVDVDVAILLGDSLGFELSGRGISYFDLSSYTNLPKLLEYKRFDAMIGYRDVLLAHLKSKTDGQNILLKKIKARPIHLLLSKKYPNVELLMEKINVKLIYELH